MKPFQTFTSLAIPLDMDNVDTDMIIPAQFLTKINREGYGKHLFHQLRTEQRNFVFNDKQYEHAQILLSKINFGCGSSREHAVWALMDAGIKTVISASFSDIFQNNAEKNGLLTICLPLDHIEMLMKKNRIMTIHLIEQTITTSEQECFSFAYDAFRKECFLKGQDDFDYLLEAVQHGA